MLLVVLAGCTTRRLAYDWADWFIIRKLDSAFALTGEQKRMARACVAAIHAWHRQTELPRYIAVLDRFQAHVATNLSRGDFEEMADQIDAAGQRLALRLAPDAGELLASLGPEQVAHLQGEMEGTEKEVFGDPGRSAEEQIRERLKRGQRALRQWTGAATPQQLGELERFIRAAHPSELRRREQMRRNGRDFLQILAQRQSAQTLSGVMQTWMEKQQIQVTPEYQQHEQQSREDFISLLMSLHGMLTAEQRGHLLHEIASLRGDLAVLASEKK